MRFILLHRRWWCLWTETRVWFYCQFCNPSSTVRMCGWGVQCVDMEMHCSVGIVHTATSAWGNLQTLFLYLDQKEHSFGFSNQKLTKVLRFRGWIKEHRFACFPLLHKQGDRFIHVSSEEEALSTVLVWDLLSEMQHFVNVDNVFLSGEHIFDTFPSKAPHLNPKP